MDLIPDQLSERRGSRTPRQAAAASNTPKTEMPAKQNIGQPETRKQAKIQQNLKEDEIISQLTDLHLGRDPALTVTALVYDEQLTEPRCLWDSTSPECPERLTAVMDKIKEYGLRQRCKLIEARFATTEEITLVHSPEFVKLIRSTETMSTEELQALSASYDFVYFHPKSYTACCLAVGCVLQLVDQLMRSQIRNGMAVVRPPGHHALKDAANGYCIFNTLAIAAAYAKKVHSVERVLIVDWGIYHGQGTQYIFEEDRRVLLFSIHRYEHGDFWPHLAESDCTADGTGRGRGYNINVPWNKTMMSDADYIAVFHRLLLPIAHEYRPNLILVAAGFDSVLGDPQGKMAATPACFAQLTRMLMPLAEGRLLLSLEGGFNLRSTAEATCACLKVLLGDPCPRLELPPSPSESALESIAAVITVHRKYWKCLQQHEASSWRRNPRDVKLKEPTIDVEETLDRTMAEVMRPLPDDRTGLLYDERMKAHCNMWDLQHPEQPDRISQIFARHKELRLVERCRQIPAQQAMESDLETCHSSEYIGTLKATRQLKPPELQRLSYGYNSIFIGPKSYDSALLAAGSVFNVVEAVLTGKVQSGVAIIRPPGHHAEKDTACGFCLFNNVAMAARFAQNLVGYKMRVLILDWDVHHGNGTQHMFEDDPSVLFISLHRYDNGSFFPNSEDAHHSQVGRDEGEGFNVNIPWNGSRMGDSEYMAAFHRVVMPIAYQYQPELVLVSAGFDAARGDPLGRCLVTPECYAHMTHMLQGLAGGRVVLSLEGGYNLTSTAESMAMCTQTLLGDTPPHLGRLSVPIASAVATISNVIITQCKYWTCLRMQIPELEPQVQSMPNLRTAPWPKQPAAAAITSVPIVEAQGQSSADRRASTWSEPLPVAEAIDQAPQTRRSSMWSPSQSFEQRAKGQASLNRNVPPWPQSESKPAGRAAEESGAGAEPAWSRSSSSATSTSGGSGARPKVKVVMDGAEQARPDVEGRESSGLQIPEVNLGKQNRRGEVPDGASSQDVSRSPSSTSKMPTDSDDDLVGGCRSSRCPESAVPRPDLTPAAEPGTVFAVTPLSWCPHLEMVQRLPASGLNVTQPCEDCGSEGENWVCLTCYQVHCGRYVNEHMVAHGMNNKHLLVLSFADLSVWCYGCDSYIHNEVLLPAKEAAHVLKFGLDLGGSS